MRKTIVICDWCKKENDSVAILGLVGNQFDVCDDCQEELLARLSEKETKQKEPAVASSKRGRKPKEEPPPQAGGSAWSGQVSHDLIVKTLGLDMRLPDEARLCEAILANFEHENVASEENATALIAHYAEHHPILFQPEYPHHKERLGKVLKELGVDFSSEIGLEQARQYKEKAVLTGVLLRDIEEWAKKEIDVGF